MLNSRRIKTKLYLLKDKYFNIKKFISIILLISILVGLIPLIIYLSVYSGYEQKIINKEEDIPEELTSAVLISDSSKENFTFLFKEAVTLYEKRKISSIYINILNAQDLKPFEDIVKSSKSIPGNIVSITNTTSLTDVCNSSKNVHELSKILILSFRDYAIRSSFLCNNIDIYAMGYVPIDTIDKEYSKDSFAVVLKEIISTTFGK